MFHDGWFYPGDLGHTDAGGFLHLDGRSKDMIIRGGVNIYPQDIERVLATDSNVADVAVVAWQSEEFGEEVAAFVVPRGEVSPETLTALCQERLASYKVPRQFFFVEQLPRTSVGKVHKRELAERLTPLTGHKVGAKSTPKPFATDRA